MNGSHVTKLDSYIIVIFVFNFNFYITLPIQRELLLKMPLT